MSKRQQLQSYLDSQLKQVDRVAEQIPTFDKLEEKLNSIEKKLINLQNSNIHINNSYQDHKSTIKKQSKQFNQQQHKQIERTPPKQLKIFSKIMSEEYFQPNPNSGKKTDKKKYLSEKKTNNNKYLDSNKKSKKQTKAYGKNRDLTNCNNFTSKKSFTFERSPNKLNKTTHEWNLRILQKDIQSCLKSNAQLKVKIGQLEGYKTQYCRLKQIFLQCQKMRKKRN